MKQYLLLRNNKQSGPYTVEELVEMGLKSHDLIWVEGISASWRFPHEVDELKSFAQPVPLEKPIERQFSALQHEITKIRARSVAAGVQLDDDEMDEFPTLARFREQARPPEPADKQIRQEVKQELQEQQRKEEHKPVAKRISVTLPAAVADKTIVVIKRREPVRVDASSVKPDEPVVSDPPANIVKTVEPIEDGIIPGPEPRPQQSTSPAVVEKQIVTKSAVQQPVSDQETIKYRFPEKRRAGSAQSLDLVQKLAVFAGLISIITVLALVISSLVSAPDSQPSVQPETSRPELTTKSAAGPVSHVSAVPQTDSRLTEKQPFQDEIIPQKDKPKEKKQASSKSASPSPSQEPGDLNRVTAAPAGQPDPKEAEERLKSYRDEVRQNISRQVNISMDGYKVGFLGGISSFELTVHNQSPYPLDNVEVELTYILSNKKVLKTETHRFSNVPANSSRSLPIPKTARGTKIQSRVISVSAADLSMVLPRQ
jgi:hypothetical protein